MLSLSSRDQEFYEDAENNRNIKSQNKMRSFVCPVSLPAVLSLHDGSSDFLL